MVKPAEKTRVTMKISKIKTGVLGIAPFNLTYLVFVDISRPSFVPIVLPVLFQLTSCCTRWMAPQLFFPSTYSLWLCCCITGPLVHIRRGFKEHQATSERCLDGDLLSCLIYLLLYLISWLSSGQRIVHLGALSQHAVYRLPRSWTPHLHPHSPPLECLSHNRDLLASLCCRKRPRTVWSLDETIHPSLWRVSHVYTGNPPSTMDLHYPCHVLDLDSVLLEEIMPTEWQQLWF